MLVTLLFYRVRRNTMKFVRLVKRILPEKSLKAYAWYGWI